MSSSISTGTKRKSVVPASGTENAKRKRTDIQGDEKAQSTILANMSLPRNAVTIRNILKDMGVEKFKPRVIDQLMEFFHRHVRDILEDAYDYQQHANSKSKTMSSQDIKLAIHNKLAYSFLGPPPPELIAARAKDINRVPLEKVSEAGIPPPSSKFLLTTPNFEIDGDVSSVEEGS
uniref:Transcription initiation factor TFIID subunit 12 domain-containing protein n=1 Tax=Norrisiella sphaerica TaxID=552664 RepID=A0A7S2QSP1_9EUKA|mmetsp:Transcript_2228/g.3145  ORF Transcript_2228/g.3145 Transcript_2228/m.3145 type:complete len:176 (+) Transcript_2228:200-727(+)|eukprot:CAMPEP_0184483100 /NCGR_PEP_ID=MMETSP0113_2-20130426/4722_1 /TAXON_ID=91329 /ORGANISM="Norrisiella sphaerica, Strain BC52" /LENGTH=175 /DNA_ID=CAMNT_0026863277 /DNA_START=182 /DNA_END=709 /DNA_ORIENTATION=-